jgi:hypothetical protein
MIFNRDFLDIQIHFAKRVGDFVELPLETLLFRYTSLPIRFGVPFTDIREDHPDWQEFVQQIPKTSDLGQAAHQHHLKIMKNKAPLRDQFGCFSFDWLADNKSIRFHFANNDDAEPGCLNKERIPQRMQELKDMFGYIKKTYPEAEVVESSSWIFHLDAFTRLMPPEFTAQAHMKDNNYHSLAVWGQFLDRYGNVKPDLEKEFYDNLQKADSLEKVEESFPFTVLQAIASIKVFYDFYTIRS